MHDCFCARWRSVWLDENGGKGGEGKESRCREGGGGCLNCPGMFRNTALLSVICTKGGGTEAIQCRWRNVWKPTRNPFVPRLLQSPTPKINSMSTLMESPPHLLTSNFTSSLRGKNQCASWSQIKVYSPCPGCRERSPKCLPCPNSFQSAHEQFLSKKSPVRSL